MTERPEDGELVPGGHPEDHEAQDRTMAQTDIMESLSLLLWRALALDDMPTVNVDLEDQLETMNRVSEELGLNNVVTAARLYAHAGSYMLVINVHPAFMVDIDDFVARRRVIITTDEEGQRLADISFRQNLDDKMQLEAVFTAKHSDVIYIRVV